MIKLYDVILADPPWRFRVWNRDTGSGRSAESHYPTLSLDEICSIDVRAITSPNAALFLWCTWPSIFEYVPKVLDAWGFTYKTCGFLWVKSRRSGFGFHMGMGYYSRANTEPCLLAVKGRMSVAARDVRQEIYSPVRQHSRKPDEQYAKIERLYPNCNYLEMFARGLPRVGWDVFGNEVENSISLKER